MNPAVSVVIPVLDGAATLPDCLDALAAQRDAPPFEVVVVDNGSGDDTVAIASAHSLAPTVLHEGRRGSYAARNAGLARARATALAFTDADCVPDAGWLATGCAALGSSDLVAGAVQPLGNPRPNVWELYDSAAYLDQRHHVEADGFGATANLFVRAEVFERVGPFDADLRSGGDVELCRRATAGGFRLLFEPGLVVGHRPRTTPLGTWKLHRRLAAGWAQLEQRGVWPPARRDPAMRIALGEVAAAATRRAGHRVRRRQLVPAHAVVVVARWTGRLTGR